MVVPAVPVAVVVPAVAFDKYYAVLCSVLRMIYNKKALAAGAPHQTPLEELTALPQTPSWVGGERGTP